MRILLVEDDAALAAALKSTLQLHGMVVDVAPNVAQARQAIHQIDYRALILDWQLPDGDGPELIELARRVRPLSPILMLTARHDKADMVHGLDAGADDYVTKPFDTEELLARIRALCRRPMQPQIPSISIGGLSYNFGHRQAIVNGQALQLPRRQLLVLEALCLRAGRTVSRRGLQDAVYAFDDLIESNTLESHVSRLRRALVPAGVEIRSVRGLGYVIRETDTGQS